MTLGKKLLIVFGATFVAATIATYAISQRLVLGSFAALEHDYATTNVTRVQGAIEEEIATLKSTCGDWSAWDDTRDFILGTKETYVKDNLQDSNFVNLKLNFMVFFDNSRKVGFSKCFDLANGKEIPLSDTFRDALLAQTALFRHTGVKDFKSGVVVLAGVPAALAACPISGNDFKGDLSGTLVIGRHVDDGAIERLADRTKLALTMRPAQGAKLPEDFVTARGMLSAPAPVFVAVRDETSIAGYGEVLDIAGKPCLLVRVNMPRDIYQHGVQSTGYFIAALLVTGAALAAALIFSLQAIVLGPLFTVSNHFRLMGEKDGLDARLSLTRTDEIGTLATEFDKMVDKLAQARKKLAEQSYSAGMSEMASGILHNVRNSLTPVTAEIGNLSHKIKNAPLAQIAQARKELADDATAPERRHALGKFLDLANQSMGNLIRDLAQGLERIESPVSQIELILTHQEQHSHAEQLLETFELSTLIKDALALVPEKLRQGVVFDIDPSVGLIGSVKAPRLILLQVFANLFINAGEAIKEAKNAAGKITVRVACEQRDNKNVLHAEVSDNGCGIDAETLPKLFQRGFSTKGTEHHGVGLHWCANTLNAGKGAMRVDSPGRGKGACFHVIFPAHTAETVGVDNVKT